MEQIAKDFSESGKTLSNPNIATPNEMTSKAETLPLAANENRQCHVCLRSTNHKNSSRCNNISCGLFFCMKCLTKKFKYSKDAANTLKRTPSWFCPVCKNKCICLK